MCDKVSPGGVSIGVGIGVLRLESRLLGGGIVALCIISWGSSSSFISVKVNKHLHLLPQNRANKGKVAKTG